MEGAAVIKKDIDNRVKVTKTLTPLEATRRKGLDCCAYSSYEVTKCVSHDCTLYPFRFGHNPNRKGIGRKNPKFARELLVESEVG